MKSFCVLVTLLHKQKTILSELRFRTELQDSNLEGWTRSMSRMLCQFFKGTLRNPTFSFHYYCHNDATNSIGSKKGAKSTKLKTKEVDFSR